MKKLIVSISVLFLLAITSAGIANADPQFDPFVIKSEKNDVSPKLKDVKPISPGERRDIQQHPLGRLAQPTGIEKKFDTVVQTFGGDSGSLPSMPSTTHNFEGISNLYGVYPPDTNGAVGPNHYVQTVNSGFQIWDKNGNSLYGPANINTLWSGFSGECEADNNGDPIVLYDHLADRWIMSQFALGPNNLGPYYECVAVSKTGDPTGAWNRYAFLYSTTIMNDYPKFGIWPDGYYMSANQFYKASSWSGAGVVAFERNKMLNGQQAQMVYFDLHNVNSCYEGLLPSDLDGTPPPAGTPNYFTSFDDGSANCDSSSDNLKIWEFHADWTTPANSTFGVSSRPNAVLTTAPFNLMTGDIPQPGGYSLDSLGDRLMYRLQYRNFGDHSAMVTNHTVDAGGGRAGTRWYELRNSGSGWSIYQQGTYAPSDTENRWMGSVAMDVRGNIALGYSVSSSTVYPSIRYAGRLIDDPLGTLGQAEASIIAGSGSETGPMHRWGDYSSMSVDPTDGCTFWYTTEYIQTTGTAPWQTRIASFIFPGCAAGKLESSPASDDFGSVNLGGASSPKTFTISNTGNANTIIASTAITGMNNSDFAITSDNCSGKTLLPTQTCTIQAWFAPTSVGQKSSSLNVTYNTSSTLTVPLSGTGIVSLTINKTGTGTGTITSSPSGINCGLVCTGQYNVVTPVTLTATPSTNSSFAGWSGGGCSGTGACTINMNSNTTVTATFTLLPPVANFSASQTTSCAPISLSFTDLSLNSPSTWLWNFGDGTTSTLQNPVHTYAAPGNYTVSLLVTNTTGSNSKSVPNYIALQTSPYLPVRIAGATPQYFSTLQQAYNAAKDQDVIQSQGIDLTGNFTTSQNIAVNLQGGYDCNYNPGWVRDTKLIGSFTDNLGTLTVGSFVFGN
ncbi:MAG TPA: PKD domain-containing protein [Geobacteraceae bacterium]